MKKSNAKPIISTEDQAKIRKKQIANIIQKVASGKGITAHEQKVLDEHNGTIPGKAGRQRSPQFEWPVWESKKQAAEVLRWPMRLLNQIQKAGCPGFTHGRVYFGEVVVWMGSRGLDDPQIDWSDSLKKWKAERERLKFEVEDKRRIERSLVNSTVSKTTGEMVRLFSQKLENEFPALVQGLDVAGCRVKGKQLLDSVMSEWRKLVEAWPE